MKELDDAMKMISPSREQKNRMFEKAESMAEKSRGPIKRKGKLLKIVCCTAAAAALIGTTTVFADEIKSAFYSIFDNDSIISEDIAENVYEDSDGHVDFSVSKLVSDGINSYAIVKYTAADDIGAEWIDGHFDSFDYENTEPLFDEKEGKYINDFFVTIAPDDNVINNIGYVCTPAKEITDNSEESSRVFRVQCNVFGPSVIKNSIKLKYYMPNGESKETKLDISESAELIEIKLDGSKAPDDSFIPSHVRFSSLGIAVYGTIDSSYESKWPYIELFIKDGSRIDIDYYGYSEIACDADHEDDIISEWFDEPVDTDSIKGIIIDGVYYEF